jgi:hypothetical protein
MVDYAIPEEYANAVCNYFVFGLYPGSFFEALFANDATKMLLHSHPGNSIEGLKHLVYWLHETNTKGVIWGSYSTFGNWIKASDEFRRKELEKFKFIYTKEEEVWMTLKGEEISKPYFY